MSIEILREAVVRHGSQMAVATKLGITPQRLSNWLRLGRVPKVWEWGLEQRLKVNGRGNGKNGSR